jgi:hypothetical protein
MRLAWCVIGVLVPLLATPASAQVGSVGSAESDRPSHAWVALPGESEVLLAHLAPRDPDGRVEPAPAGMLRPVRPLRESPEAMAAVGDRLFAVFAPAETPSGLIRRVQTLRSLPAGVKGLWTDVPSGLFDPAAALPGTGRVVGLAASAGRSGVVHALMEDEGVFTVSRLLDDRWEMVPVPIGPGSLPTDAAMLSFGPGVLLAVRGSEGSRAWTLQAGSAWEPVDLADWDRFWSARWRLGRAREVVVGTDADGGTELWTIGTESAWRLGAVTGPLGTGDQVGAVALASSGRLILIGRRDGVLLTAEVSLSNGRVIHEGPVVNRAPVSVGEFRLIVGMLLGVMVAALVVIIRPSGEAAWTVPDGYAMAEPGRRMVATFLDVLLMIWIVAPAFGATVREVLTLQVLVTDGHAWLAIPAVMVGGSLAMGVWEGLLGYSPGKFLMGVRVGRAEGGGFRKLGIFWGIVRATIKWMIPPVAALALFDREGRHRGDAAARAVVVIRAESSTR